MLFLAKKTEQILSDNQIILTSFSVSFTDLDLGRKMIILSQFLPLSRRTSFFEVGEAVVKIGSSLKLNHHLACNFSLQF